MSVRTKDPTTDSAGVAPVQAAGSPSGTGVSSSSSGVSVVNALLVAARAEFAGAGVSSLSSGEVRSALKDLTALRGAIHAFEASLRNRARELQPPPEPSPLPNPTGSGNDAPAEPDHGPRADLSPGTLDEITAVTTRTGQLRDRIARVLLQMPAIAHALANGVIAETHVEELAKAMFSATDDVWAGLIAEQADLVAAAARMQPLSFGRFISATLQRIAAQCDVAIQRDLEAEIRGSMWIDVATGMGKLSATFSPMTYQKISSQIRATADRLMNMHPGMDKKQAIGQAILQLVTQEHSDTSSGGAVGPSIAVLIDERTLFAGPHSATICEQPDGSRVPVDVAQQMACDATLIPILHDGFGIALDVGRAKRYNTPAQRTAMMSMYTTCFHNSCDVPITDCHGHHIVYWDNGGRTDMNNLLPVCQHHHRWIHANNPTITLNDKRIATVVMPNGTTTTHHPNRHPGSGNPHGQDPLGQDQGDQDPVDQGPGDRDPVIGTPVVGIRSTRTTKVGNSGVGNTTVGTRLTKTQAVGTRSNNPGPNRLPVG